MITMTVYVNGDGFCRIKNNILGSFYTENIVGTIKKTRKTPYEIQVPVEFVSKILPKKNEVVIYFNNDKITS